MSADMCPVMRLRCSSLEVCRRIGCRGDASQVPVGEDGLTRAELYQLRMVSETAERFAREQRAAQLKAAESAQMAPPFRRKHA